MNTKDEIVDVMDGYDPEGCPPPVIFTQTGTLDLMKGCGIYWPEANFDAEKMAELALQPSRQLGFATARVPYDVISEAIGMGCFYEKGSDTSQPFITGSPWRVSGTVPPLTEIVSPEEFMCSPKVDTLVRAAELISEHEDLFTTSLCNCPTMVASHILGMENMLMGLMMDENVVFSWIDSVVPHVSALAKRLSSMTDNLMLIADVTTDLIMPEYIPRLVEFDRRVLSGAKDSFITLHNCGNTLETIDLIASLKLDMVSLETSINHRLYMERSKGKLRMMGGVNTVITLLTGTPADVKRECDQAAEMGFSLVSPECGVPPLTPNRNLSALSQYRDV